MLRPDYTVSIVFGIILIIAFAITLTGIFSNASWLPARFENVHFAHIFLFVLLSASFICFFATPINIKNNNGRLVSKEVYENPKPYWDSLASGHHLIDGPY